MDGFPFVHQMTVRFRDVDAMGHVNNAVFSTYLEETRMRFFFDRGLASTLDDIAIVVARIEIDFRSPVVYGESVEVGVRATRFGTKSFDLLSEVHAEGRLAARSTTVCVGYDYGTATTLVIPEVWRKLLER